MSYATNGRIISIYNSRNTILALMEKQGYNMSEYDGFSTAEVDSMFKHSQLDMLLSNDTTKRKTYIKYYCSPKQTAKQLRPQNLDDIIEDLFSTENMLTKEDTLMIIIEEEPNDSITKRIKYLYDREGIFIVIHNIKRLQFNILNHTRVPHMRILTESEMVDFKLKYNVRDNSQIPEISRFDPQALAICMRPGQICHITRNSPTTLSCEYYRACV
jgi:DNA-directed RNA polymerase subunit H (RpoH/RPB5)